MTHRKPTEENVRVFVCCADDQLRSTLVKLVGRSGVPVHITPQQSVADLHDSLSPFTVLLAVDSDESSESALQALSIPGQATVVVLCPRARIDKWKHLVDVGLFYSYGLIDPIPDAFDLKIRIQRAIESAVAARELSHIHETLLDIEKLENAPDAVEGSRGNVLVIEDEVPAAELLCDILEPEGYAVKKASSLVDAFRTFPLELFHAILVDLIMPGVSGPKVVKMIRERLAGQQTPVIVTSAHAQQDVIQECLRLGANDFLVKPITRATLIPRLDGALRK